MLRKATARASPYTYAVRRRLTLSVGRWWCSRPLADHLDAPGHQGQAAVAVYAVPVHFALKALRFMRAATRFAAMGASNVVGDAVDAAPSRAGLRLREDATADKLRLNVGPNYVRPDTGQRRITARVMRSFTPSHGPRGVEKLLSGAHEGRLRLTMMSGFPTLGRLCAGALVAFSALARANVWSGSEWDSAAHDAADRPVAGTLYEGAVTDRFAYTAHGELAARTGTTQTPFLFLGGAGVRSEGDGLYLMGARWYDASLRRFLSPDPLGLDGGANFYAYADGDPVNRADPLGLCAESWTSGRLGRTVSQRLRYAPDSAADGRWGYVARTKGVAAAVMLALADLTGVSSLGEYATGRNWATGKYLDGKELRARAIQSMVVAASYSISAIRIRGAPAASASAARTAAAKSTPQHVFWSGGRSAENAARSFAGANNGIVVADTAAGQAVSQATRGVPWSQARPQWLTASEDFARTASGEVNVFQNARGVSLDSIWRSEYRVLQQNPNVSGINYHMVMPDGAVVPVP